MTTTINEHIIEITVKNLTLEDVVDYVFDPDISEALFEARVKWYETTFGLPIKSLIDRWVMMPSDEAVIRQSQYPA